MDLIPIKHYSAPGYPKQEILCEHPEQLRFVPKRWWGNTTVLFVLCMAAMLLVSCRNDKKVANSSQPRRVVDISTLTRLHNGWSNDPKQEPGIEISCNLKEDEARYIIQNEAEQEGLCFESDAIHFDNITSSEGRDIDVDGYDLVHGVAYEFVSNRDRDWYRNRPWLSDSAKLILVGKNKSLLTKNKWKQIAFFTCPNPISYKTYGNDGASQEHIVNPPSEISSHQYFGKKGDEKILRIKVRDFIQWLKAQGII